MASSTKTASCGETPSANRMLRCPHRIICICSNRCARGFTLTPPSARRPTTATVRRELAIDARQLVGIANNTDCGDQAVFDGKHEDRIQALSDSEHKGRLEPEHERACHRQGDQPCTGALREPYQGQADHRACQNDRKNEDICGRCKGHAAFLCAVPCTIEIRRCASPECFSSCCGAPAQHCAVGALPIQL